MSEYLDFVETRDTGKTKVYTVNSCHYGDRLATIKWYGRWRQYALYPEPGTLWNSGCLEDVTAFLKSLMAERRQRKAA